MRPSLIYAGRLERFLAYLLDTLLILITTRIAAGWFVHVNNEGDASVDPLFFPLMFLINLVYYSCFTASKWQATPGKRLLGIYVMRTDYRPLTAFDAAQRFLAFTFPLLPTYVSFLPPNMAQFLTGALLVYWFIPILYTQERTGVHDRLCHTRVLIGKVG